MPPPPLLVLGTRNEKKREELEGLLSSLGLRLRTLVDFPLAVEVVEDGDTFAANAAKKATEQARRLGQWVLGEDSGLVVDRLDGAPGIYSARFAGLHATDDENNRKLLEALGNTTLEKRTAHYVCHATLADPRGNVRADIEQVCKGRIRFRPAGTWGFGYDPLFEIVEYHRTLGQLGPHVKAAISHRARAMRGMKRRIERLLESGAWPAARD